MSDESEIIPDISSEELEEITREAKEFADRVYGNYTEFMISVAADVKEALALLRSGDSQFARRTYLRSFFSFVEGVLFAKRNIVREYTKDEASSHGPRILTDGERMLLEEIEYELADNGETRIRERNFQPFLKYLRFTFHVSAKLHRKANEVDYSGSGWQSFRAAYEVRNRITHPKSRADLLISGDELAQHKAAAAWFLKQM